jgi:hypothetical protein
VPADLLRSSGVIQYSMSRGSTTGANHNASNATIMAGILSSIGCTLMIHEDKEEDATNAYPTKMARMAAMPTIDQLFIGSAPDSTSAATQKAIRVFLRAQALANGFAFFDAYNALKDYTEVTRLGWNGDGTHLADAAYFFVASQIMADLRADIYGAQHAATTIVATDHAVPRLDGYVSPMVKFAAWAGVSQPSYAIIKNVKYLYLGGEPGSVPIIQNFGTQGIHFSASDGTSSTNLYNIGTLYFANSTRITNYSTEGIAALNSTGAAGTLAGSLLRINNTQVVGPRNTGWTAGSGTASKGAFTTSTATATQCAERILAIEQALSTHGLIGV